MTMIKCAECAAAVSDKAQACVRCGAPVGREAQAAGAALTTTQATSKRIKAMELAGAAALVVGLVGLLLALQGQIERAWLWPALTGGGLLAYFSARARRWWHHS